MHTPVIVDAIRTPLGKYGGVLSRVRPDDMMAHLLKAIVERNNVRVTDIEDVIVGCANQAGEDSRNIARMAALIAGFPYEIPGQTINRLCGSSMQAVINACLEIQTGNGDLFLAGGAESMSRGPYVMAKAEQPYPFGSLTVYDSTIGWRFNNPKLMERIRPLSMGDTAEVLFESHQIPREEQDRYAVQSHHKAAKSYRDGKFKNEIIPITTFSKKSEAILTDRDEGPREDASLEKLSQLKPAFKKNGVITAGNSCPLSDGAALTLIMSEQKAQACGFKSYFKLIAHAVTGVHPDLMGMGPVRATQKALIRAGLTVNDLDLVEINEAFAVQVLACLRELKITESKVNQNGGAIALGHPLGCSGARIITTLIHEMKRSGGRIGLATMCVGLGQGIAVIVEQVNN